MEPQEIVKLKSEVLSDNWDKAKESAIRLLNTGRRDSSDFLISLLDQSNVQARNAVALAIMDNRFQDALEPLLRSITKRENSNTRGTMAYALQSLNCSLKLRELFLILFDATKNLEVQSAILTVLDQQEFEFTEADLLEIQHTWDKLKDKWDELNGIDPVNKREYDIDRVIIQNFVDGYVSYLKKT